jgi:hypothetical protein
MIKFVTLFWYKNLKITIDRKSWVRSSNQFTSFGLLLIWLPMFWVTKGSPKHERSLHWTKMSSCISGIEHQLSIKEKNSRNCVYASSLICCETFVFSFNVWLLTYTWQINNLSYSQFFFFIHIHLHRHCHRTTNTL